jgi:hypothetical protein
MAPQMIGYLIPNISVIAVLNMRSSWQKGGVAGMQGKDIRNARKMSTGNHPLPFLNVGKAFLVARGQGASVQKASAGLGTASKL